MFKFFGRKSKDEPDSKELDTEQKHADEPSTSSNTPTKETSPSWFGRLRQSLSKTRTRFADGLTNLILGKKSIDDDLLDEIETQLLVSDIGVETTEKIIAHITNGISRKEIKDPQAVLTGLKQYLVQLLLPLEAQLDIHQKPHVLLMVGINGAGKTTTIGKLAAKFKNDGKQIMLAAGDTFRAAAVEQLQVWGDRNNVPVVAQAQGADSASVIFDALHSAKAKQVDCLIADTAGRLHTRDNLMEELKKVKRVMQKIDPGMPHEVLLVLDASIGQNALLQAIEFNKAVNITGLIITKLDGTAKGGIIFTIADQLKLPIYYIGVGEQKDDLRPFKAQEFVNAIFGEE